MNTVPNSRPPDFNISAMDTETQTKNNSIGVALLSFWKQEDGSIAVKLNDYVVLTGKKSLAIRLWPNNKLKPRRTFSGENDDNTPF